MDLTHLNVDAAGGNAKSGTNPFDWFGLHNILGSAGLSSLSATGD